MPGEPNANDPSSWDAGHGAALLRIALAQLGDCERAEDLVQEPFAAALAALDRFEGRSSPRTWLVAILRRKIIDQRRRAGAESRAAETPGPPPFFDARGHWARPPSRWDLPGGSVERAELRSALDGCVDRLPRHLAEPFLLRECDGLETDEVGRVLGLTPANLRVRLHRARLLLRECLERTGFGDRDRP